MSNYDYADAAQCLHSFICNNFTAQDGAFTVDEIMCSDRWTYDGLTNDYKSMEYEERRFLCYTFNALALKRARLQYMNVGRTGIISDDPTKQQYACYVVKN